MAARRKDIEISLKDGNVLTIPATIVNEYWAYHKPHDSKLNNYYVITHIASGLRIPHGFKSAKEAKATIERMPNGIELTEEYIKECRDVFHEILREQYIEPS